MQLFQLFLFEQWPQKHLLISKSAPGGAGSTRRLFRSLWRLGYNFSPTVVAKSMEQS